MSVNPDARVIAIGDIHGCKGALDRILKEIEPTSADTLVGIGDYVDRGMDSAGVIETLLKLIVSTRFIPLIGNHELMMYRGLYGKPGDFEFWCQHGGTATLGSYGGRVENIPAHHLTFLTHCIRCFEMDDFFFVHAAYDPVIPVKQTPDEVLFWQHLKRHIPPPHANGKIAVVGHTPCTDGNVVDHGHLKMIDTYCYGDQWLSALEVRTGDFWQANNWGDFRKGNLESLPPREQAEA